MKRVIFGLVVVAIGVLLLLRNLGVVDFSWLFNISWSLYWAPICIIIVGLVFMFSRSHTYDNGMVSQPIPECKDGEPMHSSVAFSGNSYNYNGEQFNGAVLDAFMGGISLDLRGALIEDNCMIQIKTFMGGVEVKVPQNVAVEVSSNCLIGGVGNHSSCSRTADTKVIRVDAKCFMGGVDIKN